MRNSYNTSPRIYAKGIGDAVANRTYNRKKPDGTMERWEDVAFRVAYGNSLLAPHRSADREFHALHHHLRQASTLMAGRHLQHGDMDQPNRNMEVFTNCSTAASTFLSFYLLLNGSGVGRAYDDDMIVVDFNKMPIVVPVINMAHKDVQSGEISVLTFEQAEHLYEGQKKYSFIVPDSREGWAQAVEQIEVLTFTGEHRNDVLILDFSNVRPRGSLIGGMQNRPASGPGPLIAAIKKMAELRNATMSPWRAAMYADHYMSECVLVGGARRAARMSTKSWRDSSVIDFIRIKQGGFMWSSNNSVTVDEEFWKLVRTPISEVKRTENIDTIRLAKHAKAVFEAICEHSYKDGTGEPGIINQDKLTGNDKGLETFAEGGFVESTKYQLTSGAKMMMAEVAKRFVAKPYKMITNPCGEIVLSMLGGYCVIADVVPYHAGSTLKEPNDCKSLSERDTEWDADAEDAFRTTTRALIRVNRMDSLYKAEVKRTNRIGVGLTGLHEYAWERFGLGFKDLVNEERSKDFWLMLSRFKRAVVDEAEKYSAELGVGVPHTNTTIKPSGTISKLFGLTEGAHLPSMREYMRWVQFTNSDPLIAEYRNRGYPIRKLQTYGSTTVVGFPTQPAICTLGMGDKLMTAPEASLEDQYQWLRLLEKYWIRGVEADGVTPLAESGNQVSYTMKYNPKTVSYDDFKLAMLNGQSTVRCCSVMPSGDTSAYEYLPEQPVTKAEFEVIAQAILHDGDGVKEDADLAHVDCSSGACPIDFKDRAAA